MAATAPPVPHAIAAMVTKATPRATGVAKGKLMGTGLHSGWSHRQDVRGVRQPPKRTSTVPGRALKARSRVPLASGDRRPGGEPIHAEDLSCPLRTGRAAYRAEGVNPLPN